LQQQLTTSTLASSQLIATFPRYFKISSQANGLSSGSPVRANNSFEADGCAAAQFQR
jgi:hypothetical protein